MNYNILLFRIYGYSSPVLMMVGFLIYLVKIISITELLIVLVIGLSFFIIAGIYWIVNLLEKIIHNQKSNGGNK